MALRPLALPRHLERDRDYYGSLLRIALPISVQGLISASLNLIDNVMVAHLDSTALAAVGLANSIYFILAIALFGVSSGLTVFIAQYWGKKDLEGVRRATGLGILVSGGLALVAAVATASFPGAFMRIFSGDPAVVAQGAVFLRRIAPSYPLAGLSFMFYGSMRSTEHAKLPLWPTTIALGLNTLLNYMLIYGNFGAPKMGVQGSATATLIARTVEIAITIGMVYGLRLPAAVSWRQIFRVDGKFLATALKISLPVVGNETLWVVGISFYPAIYAHMGTDVIAAATVSSTIDRLAFVLAVGMGNAAAAIVGKQIGAGRKDLAYRYGGLSLVIAPLLALAIGAVVFLTRPYVLPWFGIQGAVLDNAMLLVALSAATLWMKSFTMVSIVGVLRAGGDTLVAMLLDIGALWLIAVPLASLGGLVFGWPLLAVYLCTSVDELIKVAISLWRYLSKKWIHDLVNGPADALPDLSPTPSIPDPEAP